MYGGPPSILAWIPSTAPTPLNLNVSTQERNLQFSSAGGLIEKESRTCSDSSLHEREETIAAQPRRLIVDVKLWRDGFERLNVEFQPRQVRHVCSPKGCARGTDAAMQVLKFHDRLLFRSRLLFSNRLLFDLGAS